MPAATRPLSSILPLALLAACSGPPAEPAPVPAETRSTTGEGREPGSMQPPALAFETPDAGEGADGYRARATALLARLVPGEDLAVARREAGELMELGAAMVPDFVTRHPHCREYIDIALQVREGWPTMDLETIERDYHHDGVLPKIENATVCYHMKDLVVHPATVLVLLSAPQPDYAKARGEIEEVIAHVGFVARD